MLAINELNVRYGKTQVLANLNLTLKAGNTLSIIGESGAGKTTLGLSIMGLLNGNSTGEIIYKDKNILAMRQEELQQIRGKKIAMVFQNVDNVLNPVFDVLDQVGEAILIHNNITRSAAK